MAAAPPQHLFTPAGEAALGALMQQRPLLAFDFDGTLAPIVARPQDAVVPAAVSARLAALGRRYPVAIVTGRAIADVRHRLGFVPQHVVGNHGAEDDALPADQGALVAALDPLRRTLGARAADLAGAGVLVEDKALSIALHYRLARDPVRAAALIEEVMAGLPASLQVFAGKMVVNAMATHAPDKAEAVRRLQQRVRAAAVFYAGDDVNDEPVFVAAPEAWLTVRIGQDGGGTRARYFLAGIDELTRVLDRMLGEAHAG